MTLTFLIVAGITLVLVETQLVWVWQWRCGHPGIGTLRQRLFSRCPECRAIAERHPWKL